MLRLHPLIRITVASGLLLLLACGGETVNQGTDAQADPDAAAGSDGAVNPDAAPSDAAPSDAAPTDAAPADAGPGPDGGVTITHYGVVSVANVNAGFVGQIRGAFVPATDLILVTEGRSPIAGAPGCYEVLATPPVVPTYFDAGTLLFEGLILANHTLPQNPGGDYSFDYANLLETPGAPVTLTVPGAAVIEPMAATVSTPDPAPQGTWTFGSTGNHTTWTPGNGDYVLLHFTISLGLRVCEVPDTGSFLIPAQAFAPDATPAGNIIQYTRVIETTSLSASGTQELRFRAFTQHELVGP